MTASLVEKSNHDGSEFHVFLASDFENVLLSRSILERGWRIVAVYEVMVPMCEAEYNNGVNTTRNVLRPEARFLCLRGERGDLVEGLQCRLAALAADLLEAKKHIGALGIEKDVLTTKMRQLEERHSTLRNNADTIREDRDKAHQRLKDARAHHQKLEADFGAVRAAIGEIALKKILDTVDPKAVKVLT